MTPAEQEQQRRVLAARARLREGFTTREKVDQLCRLVASNRGQSFADQLRDDMRKQWRIRNQWMGEPPTGPPG